MFYLAALSGRYTGDKYIYNEKRVVGVFQNKDRAIGEAKELLKNNYNLIKNNEYNAIIIEEIESEVICPNVKSSIILFLNRNNEVQIKNELGTYIVDAEGLSRIVNITF